MIGLLMNLGTEYIGGASPSKVQNEQLFEQQTVFGEQQGFEQQMANLYKDPWSVTKTPGYQFQLQQGLQGVARQYGAAGLGGGGAASDALMRYGQGYAQNSWMQQLGFLAGLSGIQGGAGSTAGLGANALAGSQQRMGAAGTSAGFMSNMASNMMGGAGIMAAMFA